ncbi:MAG: T9SS type A sorting domain-containing protein [Bacteroidales bacterium]
MKKLLFSIFLLIPIAVSAQLRVFAGNDTTFCADCILNGTAQLGTTMKVQGGTPPYYYVWSMERVESWIYYPDYSSQCLSSNTSPTPYLKEFFSNGRFYPFVLTVIDANYNRAKDTIWVGVSIPQLTSQRKTLYANIGDTIQINDVSASGGILPYKLKWYPQTDVINPDSINPKVIFKRPITYNLIMEDVIGCKTISKAIHLREKPKITSYLNNGDVWNYKFTQMKNPYSMHESHEYQYNQSYIVQKDTIIDSLPYKSISKSFNDGPYYHFCALRESQGKWFIKYSNQVETLSYDFNLLKNDTLYDNYGDIRLVVSNIDTVVYNNQIRKRYSLYNYGMGETWIEGIGCTYDLNHYSPNPNYQYTELLCFHSNGQQIYKNPTIDYCKLLGSGIEQRKQNSELQIKSNPISPNDYRIISGSEISNISIINSQGKIVQQLAPFAIDATVSLANQPKGVYVVRVSTSDGVFVRKIVKK